jgi:cation/acetate symporter
MSQFAINLLFVGASFALYIGIAIWARAGSTKDFYVAGGGVHPITNGMATAADWMSAASFISMAGLLASGGYANSTFLMGWTGGYVILAMLLAPYLRKFGKFTVPDFIGDRFYSNTAPLLFMRLEKIPIISTGNSEAPAIPKASATVCAANPGGLSPK